MPFVLDASIAACWVFQDEQDARADAAYVRIKIEEAVVPISGGLRSATS